MAPDKSMEEQLNWAVGKRNVTKSGAIGVKLIAPFLWLRAKSEVLTKPIIKPSDVIKLG
jgi:hypothetical protein